MASGTEANRERSTPACLQRCRGHVCCSVCVELVILGGTWLQMLNDHRSPCWISQPGSTDARDKDVRTTPVTRRNQLATFTPAAWTRHITDRTSETGTYAVVVSWMLNLATIAPRLQVSRPSAQFFESQAGVMVSVAAGATSGSSIC